MTALEEASTLKPDTREVLLKVKAAILHYAPDATVLVYGSVARGTNGPDSDYDILVMTDEPLPWRTESVVDGAVYDVQLDYGELITVIFVDRQTWERHPAMPFHVEVKRDGIIL